MGYTPKQIEEFKSKAEKWDKLDAEISECYSDENLSEESETDLGSIGEIAAMAFGYL
jgi:hypothetical protein